MPYSRPLLGLLLCFVFVATNALCANHSHTSRDAGAILSEAFATDNALRPGEWDIENLRDFARVPISPSKELLVVAIQPGDSLWCWGTKPTSNQVFVLHWRDSSNGLLRMPIAPYTIEALGSDLQKRVRSAWTEIGVTQEHQRALAAQIIARRLETFRIPRVPSPQVHNAEWFEQMTLLSFAVEQEAGSRSLTNGVVIIRDFGVLDERYVGAAYCDGRYWALRILPLRDPDTLSVIHFDAVISPIVSSVYDQTLDAIRRCSGSLTWALHRGKIFDPVKVRPPGE